MRVGLIGCGKEKLDHAAPAKDLYVGSFFKLCKQWISKPGRVDEWAILSAKYGLVLPEQAIEPYDCTLNGGMYADYKARQSWAIRTSGEIVKRWCAQNTVFMILAGANYRMAVEWVPMVEDVIRCWTDWRRESGMRRPQMSIGVIKKYLKNDEGYY